MRPSIFPCLVCVPTMKYELKGEFQFLVLILEPSLVLISVYRLLNLYCTVEILFDLNIPNVYLVSDVCQLYRTSILRANMHPCLLRVLIGSSQLAIKC